jgi:hypothetical protein
MINVLSIEDLQVRVKLRLMLAEKNIAKEYLKKNDAVQASEKEYKVSEEVVKALGKKFRLI